MKAVFTFIFLILPIFSFSQTQKETEAMGTEQDEIEKRGLKQYIFVMYTKGNNRTHDSATTDKIQAQHLNHLDSLAKIGVLNVAGPFLEEHDWRGL